MTFDLLLRHFKNIKSKVFCQVFIHLSFHKIQKRVLHLFAVLLNPVLQEINNFLQSQFLILPFTFYDYFISRTYRKCKKAH